MRRAGEYCAFHANMTGGEMQRDMTLRPMSLGDLLDTSFGLYRRQFVPLVFVGTEYWNPLLSFLRDRLLAESAIDAVDFDRIRVTDSAEVAVRSITDIAVRQFGLTYAERPKRRWFLWE